MIRIVAPLTVFAVLTACGDGAGLKAPAATYASTGEPAVDCISTTLIRSSDVIDDHTIDFHMIGNRIYRNTLPSSCPGLTEDRAFSYRLNTTELCSVDIITVIHPGTRIPGPSCGLGHFEPIARTAPH